MEDDFECEIKQSWPILKFSSDISAEKENEITNYLSEYSPYCSKFKRATFRITIIVPRQWVITWELADGVSRIARDVCASLLVPAALCPSGLLVSSPVGCSPQTPVPHTDPWPRIGWCQAWRCPEPVQTYVISTLKIFGVTGKPVLWLSAFLCVALRKFVMRKSCPFVFCPPKQFNGFRTKVLIRCL